MSSFGGESELDGSASSRYDVWSAGVEITLANPAFGVGPNCARYLVPIYLGTNDINPEKSLHNLFLEISAGCGIPAFIFYLMFFLVPGLAIFWQVLFHFRKFPRWLQTTYLACLAGLTAFMLGSMFSAAAQLESSYMLVAIANAAQLVYARQLREGTALSESATVVEKRVGLRRGSFGNPIRDPAVSSQ
jgi:O-antigen ligase